MRIELKNAMEKAISQQILLPVQRSIGAGYAIQADMVAALPVPIWEELIKAYDDALQAEEDEAYEARTRG